MASSRVPGLSVAVVPDGDFVWSAGFGMTDLENSVPATSRTLYRLGSISKPITATAAMRLWESGKLDLDSPVQKDCPAFPQKPWPITTRELLGQLGGIRSYNVPELPYSKSQSDPEVGNTRHFENGIAIEGASGKKYADSGRENVLVPAGMVQTRPDDRFAIIPLRTRFYSRDKSGPMVNAEFLDSSYKVPGGGWLSCAPDMARFEAAILNDRLPRRATREIMWTAQVPSDGLGWQLGVMGGVKDVGHGGSQQGTSAMMLIAPDARAGVVVLTNADSVGASALASRVLRIVLGLPEPKHREIAIDPGLFDGYAGKYQLGDFSMGVARAGDRLVAQIRDQTIPLLPESARGYVLKGSDTQIIFVSDGNGRTTGLILRENGTDAYLSRIE